MNIRTSALLITALGASSVHASQNAPKIPGQALDGKPVHEAYLFAHMKHSDYGRLYYSVSLDGLHWRELNTGKRVSEEYRGHPDICKGHDGRYYLVGNNNDEDLNIKFWVSDDLLEWELYSSITPELQKTPGYEQARNAIGAPKLFYDEVSSRYILTWHTPHVPDQIPMADERYWASQRTLVITSKDLKKFDKFPQRLFPWDMATIDTFIRWQGNAYFAILKDERYPSLDCTTGKTIGLCRSDSPLGPWSELSAPISPNFREAATLIPSPDGKVWYLYYEQYPGVSYGLSVAADLDGPWFQSSGNTHFADWDKYSLPPAVRHGCMLPISRKENNAMVEEFGISGE
jgi:hypothetical protein